MSRIWQEGNYLVLEYYLYDLPTVQHKAGLAGLLLLIDTMSQEGEEPVPEVLKLDTVYARIRFSEESFRNMFQYLYAAATEERKVKQKRQGSQPIRDDEEMNAEGKLEKWFVYRDLKPLGKFFQFHYPAGEEKWLKLWQDMLWSVIRSSPKSRTPFEEINNGKDLSLAKKTWASLLKKSKRPDVSLLEDISGSIFIGAQAQNSELVGFQGEVLENLLLHFWQVIVMVYVPRDIKITKNKVTGGLDAERTEIGYVLALPEPSDLEWFCKEYEDFLRRLPTDKNNHYRPQRVLIDIPAEAGLEFIYRLTSSKLERGFSGCISSVEIFHLERRGNNVKVHAAESILPDEGTLNAYQRLMDGKELNPLYKVYRIRNLLNKNPWHQGMDALFYHYDWRLFVKYREETPQRIPFFGLSVWKEFDATRKALDNIKGDGKMDKDKALPPEDQLELLIYEVVQRYIWLKTDEKSPVKYEKFKDNKDEKGKVIYPKEYCEAREKICRDAFLAVRGRKSQAFLDYFTGTICSVPQYLPSKDFQLVSQALINDWEKVKTLTLLAISANSYLKGGQ